MPHMSFFKCCVGADPRSTSDDEHPRPVSTSLSRRGGAHSAFASDGAASKRKMKLPTEVFFDPTKPDGHLSSVTDPATSMRDVADVKKRRDNTRSNSRKLSVKVGMASNDDIHNPNYYYNNSQQQQHAPSRTNPQSTATPPLPPATPPLLTLPSSSPALPPAASPHRPHPSKTPDLDAQDNNGLTRGQNFMKVEKWLRQACLVEQVDITPPKIIKNIEDNLPSAHMPDHMADPPSEKDRLPPALNPNTAAAAAASAAVATSSR